MPTTAPDRLQCSAYRRHSRFYDRPGSSVPRTSSLVSTYLPHQLPRGASRISAGQLGHSVVAVRRGDFLSNVPARLSAAATRMDADLLGDLSAGDRTRQPNALGCSGPLVAIQLLFMHGWHCTR